MDARRVLLVSPSQGCVGPVVAIDVTTGQVETVLDATMAMYRWVGGALYFTAGADDGCRLPQGPGMYAWQPGAAPTRGLETRARDLIPLSRKQGVLAYGARAALLRTGRTVPAPADAGPDGPLLADIAASGHAIWVTAAGGVVMQTPEGETVRLPARSRIAWVGWTAGEPMAYIVEQDGAVRWSIPPVFPDPEIGRLEGAFLAAWWLSP